MKTIIYWNTNHPKFSLGLKRKIRDKFNIPSYTSVNGETPCDIRDEDLELLRETERKGYIQIRNKV